MIKITFEQFNEKLNDIQNEVQKCNDNIEKLGDVLKKIQKQYEDNTNNLLKNLECRYNDIIVSVEDKYKGLGKDLAKAYDRQIDIINEFTTLNAQQEKDKKLQGQISRVFIANPSLKAEKIMIRSSDIMRIDDLSNRHSTAKSHYDRFVLCSELFSNKEEMPKIKAYLDQLENLPSQFEHIMKREVRWGDLFDAFGDIKEFARSRDYRQWCGLHHIDEGLFQQGHIKGGNGVCHNYGSARVWPGSRFGWMNSDVDYYSHKIGHIILEDIDKENNRRQKHNEELQKQIQNTIFPSEAFDSLVDQFNEFISKL